MKRFRTGAVVFVISCFGLPAFAGEPCGTGGPCDTANGAPGCDDVDCCEAVCAIETACCDIGWDDLCVDIASTSCGGGNGGCGDPASGDCLTDTGTPFCSDQECCETVCAIDPFCCETSWDGICAGEAEDLCGGDACDIGSGTSQEGEACGDQINDGCLKLGGDILATDISLGDNIEGILYGFTDPDGGGFFDLDYYRVEVSSPMCIAMEVYSQFPTISAIASLPDCNDNDGDGAVDLTVLVDGLGECPQVGEIDVDAGTYYIIVRSYQIFSPVCGSGLNDYVLKTYSCGGGNECPADFDGDMMVGPTDLTALLAGWNQAIPDLDLDGSGLVDAGDLTTLLASWGEC